MFFKKKKGISFLYMTTFQLCVMVSSLKSYKEKMSKFCIV